MEPLISSRAQRLGKIHLWNQASGLLSHRSCFWNAVCKGCTFKLSWGHHGLLVLSSWIMYVWPRKWPYLPVSIFYTEKFIAIKSNWSVFWQILSFLFVKYIFNSCIILCHFNNKNCGNFINTNHCIWHVVSSFWIASHNLVLNFSKCVDKYLMWCYTFLSLPKKD